VAEEMESSKCQIRTLEALAELAKIHMPADTTAAPDDRNRLPSSLDSLWRQYYLINSQFGRHLVLAFITV
jgi:hypothetical protein